MLIAMTTVNNSLALLRWHHFGFFHHHYRHGGVIWLVIGLVLVAVVVWAFLHRGRRWS